MDFDSSSLPSSRTLGVMDSFSSKSGELSADSEESEQSSTSDMTMDRLEVVLSLECCLSRGWGLAGAAARGVPTGLLRSRARDELRRDRFDATEAAALLTLSLAVEALDATMRVALAAALAKLAPDFM